MMVAARAQERQDADDKRQADDLKKLKDDRIYFKELFEQKRLDVLHAHYEANKPHYKY